MASTNKTTNYNLSQYVGSDKPTYLGDYNGDMQKIDTQMKANADSATSANSLATLAKNTADLAEEHAQTGITNAGTADTKATNAQNTATSALTKATKNESDISKLNITRFQQYGTSDLQITGATLGTGANITVASNADGSIGKIYGTVPVTDATSETPKVVIPGSYLRPVSDININGIAINFIQYDLTGGAVSSMPYNRTVTIKTNGDIELIFNEYINGKSKMLVMACLLFIKDFGDTTV